jgi:hypothetical protein
MAVWNSKDPVECWNIGYGFSTDGGNTWSHSEVPDVDDYYIYAGDPSCAFDRYGNAYCCYIARAACEPLMRLGPVYISRTSDFGESWVAVRVGV